MLYLKLLDRVRSVFWRTEHQSLSDPEEAGRQKLERIDLGQNRDVGQLPITCVKCNTSFMVSFSAKNCCCPFCLTDIANLEELKKAMRMAGKNLPRWTGPIRYNARVKRVLARLKREGRI